MRGAFLGIGEVASPAGGWFAVAVGAGASARFVAFWEKTGIAASVRERIQQGIGNRGIKHPKASGLSNYSADSAGRKPADATGPLVWQMPAGSAVWAAFCIDTCVLLRHTNVNRAVATPHFSGQS